MRARQRRCDVCQDPTGAAKTYTVTSNGRTASTARCVEHGTELEQVFDNSWKRRGRDGRQRVTTLEEIEARKAQRSLHEP